MSLKRDMAKGAVWITLDKVSTQAIQFILGIIIARIVSPSDFGTLGIILIFINFSNIIVDSGFGKALIQKNTPSSEDYSTVFLFNLLIAIILYFIIWFISPSISTFYKMSNLTVLMRTLAIILIFNSIIVVPSAIFITRLDFKSLAKANFISALLSGLIGIALAYNGFNIWALVVQTISRVVILSIILKILIKWSPSLVFSFESLKSLYRYGVNLFTSSFIGVFINEMNSLVIGKSFGPAALGYYTRGVLFGSLPYSTITSIVYGVLFPSLSSIKNDKAQLISISRDTIRHLSFISFPIMLWIAMIAEPLVRILLTDKWLPTVPIIQVICIARMITIIAGVSVELLNATGRSDLTLKQDLLKIMIRIIFLLISYKYGILWIAIAELCATFIHFFINTYYPGKFLKYGAFEQIKDIYPIILSAVLSSISGFILIHIIPNDFIAIVVSLICAIMIYTCSLLFFKQVELFSLSRKILQKIIHRF